jgi:6,7-dimethyl-8-ribityllumazine synthase
MPTFEGSSTASGLRIGIVVSRWNDFVTTKLLAGARAALVDAGVAEDGIDVAWVPGAYEIAAAARQLAATRRPAAVVCLGCVIRGGTPHFEYIASAAAHGIADAAAATGVPMTFGVLTTDSVEQAIERAAPGPANKGREAALAAVEMATLFQALEAAR